ncbi:endonuclease [Mycoplasmatota bacterium WC30]
MTNGLKKITTFLLIIIATITFISCDNVSTTTTSVTTESTTSLNSEGETTITTQEITVTTSGDTTITTTLTTIYNTTTEVTTTESTTTQVITTEATTTEVTTTEATTTEATTAEVTTAESTTTESTTTESTISLQVGVVNSEYTLGDDFDENSIIVNLVRPDGSSISLSSTNYTVSGFNSTVAGTITLTVSYYIYSATFDVTIVDPIDGFVITMEYYFDAQGLTGSELFDELHTIINTGFEGVTYDDAKYALGESDADPNISGNVILVYLGTSIDGFFENGDWTYPAWNREHVWPQSLLPGSANYSTVNICSDLHNLKPSDVNENSSRGSKYFDDYMSSVSYEPRDEVKGDVARILFYMITMYDELSLVNTSPGYLEMGLFDVLLEWNDLDPVDDFERNRNNVIDSYQFNRNPYIDYPEFVDMIWG